MLRHIGLATLCLGSLLGCISPASESLPEAQLTLHLALSTPEGDGILFSEGSVFTLYKDEQMLYQGQLENQAVQLQPVSEAPPYHFTIKGQADIEPNRGIPIDTQGGLLGPVQPASPLPHALLPEWPSTLPQTDTTLEIQGSLTEDLREVGTYVHRQTLILP